VVVSVVQNSGIERMYVNGREKRAIIEEERRLRALLDLEKSRLHTKEDFLAAVKADRRRRESKELYARQERIM